MVAFCEDDFGENPKTLCDWVKNFRIKKIQMKRKFRGGGDLRVCAILSTALLSAEHELRRKQQERFNRWLEMQAKLEASRENVLTSYHGHSDCQPGADNEFEFSAEAAVSTVADEYVKSNVFINVANEERQRRDEITNLWKYELSGLDEFMRNISSSNSVSDRNIMHNNNSSNFNNNGNYCNSNSSSAHAIQVAS